MFKLFLFTEGEISQLLTQKEAAIIAAARSRFGEMPNLEFLPDTSYIREGFRRNTEVRTGNIKLLKV